MFNTVQLIEKCFYLNKYDFVEDKIPLKFIKIGELIDLFKITVDYAKKLDKDIPKDIIDFYYHIPDGYEYDLIKDKIIQFNVEGISENYELPDILDAKEKYKNDYDSFTIYKKNIIIRDLIRKEQAVDRVGVVLPDWKFTALECALIAMIENPNSTIEELNEETKKNVKKYLNNEGYNDKHISDILRIFWRLGFEISEDKNRTFKLPVTIKSIKY